MEGEDPYPCACDSAWGAFSSLAHSCPVEPKYVHPYIYIVFLFPFLRRGLRFYSILSFLFFGCTCDPVDFFFLFFVFLGLCFLGSLGLWENDVCRYLNALAQH